MNASNLNGAITQFLELCGDPGEQKFLKFWHRESFFDHGVQSVLMERHPANHHYETPSHHLMPILGWSIADQQALATMEGDHTEERATAFFLNERVWFSKLTVAVGTARASMTAWRSNPQSTLERFIVWREAAYLMETSRVTPRPTVETYGEAMHFVFQGAKIKNGSGAIRKAVFDENQRRELIMQTWAEPWLIYLRGGKQPPHSAWDLRRKILARTGVTKNSGNK